MAEDPTALTHSFTYDSKYLIKWTSIGPKDGPPIILIHGTPWSSRLYSPLALALSKTHHVYLFDNPGYGVSKTLTAESTAEQANDGPLRKQAEVFAALYHHWGFGEGKAPHVIAHDNGGLAALRVNLSHNCVYRSLCLIDVVATGPWGSPFFKLVAENVEVFQAIPAPLFEGLVRGYIRSASFNPLSKENEDMLAAPWTNTNHENPGQAGFIRQICQASKRVSEDVEGRYHEVGEKGVRVKIIWGKEDGWLPVERAEKLGRLFGGEGRGCEVVVVEEAGHLAMLDQPERVLTEIVGFLRGVDGDGV